MATQLTISDDVAAIAVASTPDGLIRWHVYERVINGVSALYVQRELDGTFIPEVQLVVEGKKPRIYFDTSENEWVLLYELNENIFMLRYAEAEVPSLIPAQAGETAIDHFRSVPGGRPDNRTFAQNAAAVRIGVGPMDAYNGPKAPESVKVGASSIDGNVVVRFLPASASDGVRVAGFLVHRRRASDGALETLTSLTPPVGVGVQEIEVPFALGEYYVTQVNYAGLGTLTKEGRIQPPGDLIDDDLTIIESLHDSRSGDGQTLDVVRVQAGVVTVLVPLDTFASATPGDGHTLTASAPVVSQPIVLPAVDETFDSVTTGDGQTLFVQRSDFGIITLG